MKKSESQTGIKPMTSLTYHTHNDFDSADPSSMQDACTYEVS